jgi:transposase
VFPSPERKPEHDGSHDKHGNRKDAQDYHRRRRLERPPRRHRWLEGDTLRVKNDARGHRRLIRWIGRGAELVVFEPTSRSHRAFEAALAGAELPFARLHPTRARRFAEAAGLLAKTNRVAQNARFQRDAGMLARMGALLEPAPEAPPSPVQAELAELERARAGLQRDRLAAANRAGQATHPLVRRQAQRAARAAERAIARDRRGDRRPDRRRPDLARKAAILVSIPGISAVSDALLLAEMPEIGTLEAGEAASLASLAPMTRESGRWRGKARIRGGRAALRKGLFMPALAAARCNPDLKAVHDRHRAAGKPPKLALTAVMRKLLLLANALVRDNRTWTTAKPA